MKKHSNDIPVASVPAPGLARPHPWFVSFWLGAWLVFALASHRTATAQLAITEVMSSATNMFGTNVVVAGPDYWELSNFSTNDIDLTGYRFNDNDGGLLQADRSAFQGLTIKAHESIVFYSGSISTNAFRAWWGLGTNVRVFPYPASGYGLSPNGDTVLFWGRAAVDDADLVDSVNIGEAKPGFSFTYDPVTGEWGVSSIPGLDGAFRAATADDVGSPGTNTGPVRLSFAEDPVSVLANPDDAATFSVRYRGLPRPTFQWFHNDTPIPGARSSTYTVPSVQTQHTGSYSVVLSNYFQVVASATATLTISITLVPPQFIQSPTDLWVFPDQEATFRSVATGLPQPVYQWRRNGMNISGATNRTLVVPPPHSVGTNVYSVVVSNLLGAATNAAKLLVFERPDLRITELMAREKSWQGIDKHEDWWELTNFGTNAVDLFGYGFDDFTEISHEETLPRLQYASVLTNHVIIQTNESIVFVENMTAEQFKRWWGWTNLPPALQVITYTGGGLSFSQSNGDGLALWNMGATWDGDVVNVGHPEFTFVSYSALDLPDALGVSFTINPEIPDDFCCYQFSGPGVNGAFIAAEGGDIGSPGYIRTPTDPRIISIVREPAGWRLTWRSAIAGNCVLQWRETLATGPWLDLATLPVAGAATSYLDTNEHSIGQCFYRVVRHP